MRKRRIKIKTATAVIGVKGTDFVTEFKEETTVVGTVDGLVNMSSLKTKQSVDIPPGKMSSVSPSGEVMPLSEIAGELLKGVEFAGKKMDSKDIAGEKIKM
jgi:ferric-dicitrate binding protein FerR (iron transport regulator)